MDKKNKTFRCGHCGDEYNKKYKLFEHMYAIHNISEPKKGKNKLIINCHH